MGNKTDKIATSAIQLINENIFLNSNQIMKIFGITRSTLDKWKKTKGFPEELYLTKRPIWKKEEILNWAESFNKENPLWKQSEAN